MLSTPPSALGFSSTVPSKPTANTHTSNQEDGTSSKSDLYSAQVGSEGDPEQDIHERATTEIENGVHALETLLEATVDKTFDKFEIYALRNILTVPEGLGSWLRLGHYEVSVLTALFCG